MCSHVKVAGVTLSIITTHLVSPKNHQLSFGAHAFLCAVGMQRTWVQYYKRFEIPLWLRCIVVE